MPRSKQSKLEFEQRIQSEIARLRTISLAPLDQRQTVQHRGHGESIEQMCFFARLSDLFDRYPDAAWCYAVPNGEKREIQVAIKLMLMGVRAGIFDVGLDVPRGPYHGWRCEFKSPTGKLSPEQKLEQPHYEANGYAVTIAHSWESARDALIAYLSLLPVVSTGS